MDLKKLIHLIDDTGGLAVTLTALTLAMMEVVWILSEDPGGGWGYVVLCLTVITGLAWIAHGLIGSKGDAVVRRMSLLGSAAWCLIAILWVKYVLIP